VVGTKRVAEESAASRVPQRTLWGVPLVPDHFVAHAALNARLESWAAGASLLVVDAPTAYGKTAALAGWLRERTGSHPVVWISCGQWVNTPEAVWETLMTGMVDAGLIPREAVRGAPSDTAAFGALQALHEPIIVVYDDLHRIGPELDLDQLARVAKQVPLVRTVAIVSGSEESRRRNDADRVVIDADALAWDGAMVKAAARRLYGEQPNHIPYAAVTRATGGRAGAVLHYLSASGGAAGEPRGTGGWTPSDIVLDWSLRNLRKAEDGGLRLRVLSMIALSIRMPAPLLASLSVEIEAEAAVAALIDEGMITVRQPTGESELSYEVSAQERPMLEVYAASVLGEQAADIHRLAAEYHRDREPALALHHLARAGCDEQAVQLVKRIWPRVGTSVPLQDFRAAIAAISDQEYRRDLEALAVRVLSSRVPPVEIVRRRDLETYLINASSARLRAIPLERRALVTAASLWVLLARGRVRDAIALGSRAARQFPTAGWDARADLAIELSVLWNLTAEAYLLAGLPRQAIAFIRKATDVSSVEDNVIARYRTILLAAMAYALNGEFDRAAELIAEARLTSATARGAASSADYPLVIAEALLSHSMLDAEGMSRAAAWFESIAGEDPRWKVAARLCEAYGLLFAGEPDAGLAMIRRILHGASSASNAIELGTVIARGLEADILIALGKPGRAIEGFHEITPPAGHAVCTSTQIASAHLAMGRPRLALRDTDACIEQGVEHSWRTLPSILLRRAVAHEMLGHVVAADDSFLEAFLLVRSSPALAPYLNLARAPIEQLFARLAVSHPEYADDAVELWSTVENSVALLRPERVRTALSERELRVLGLLATGLTVTEMGAALFVSANTVKTQISSIYRKLGVSTRAEATDVAAAMGLVAEA
jgi:DNA-binding CsgD family transcriptional regulator/tetratricopeptide (TPR) repeat protein